LGTASLGGLNGALAINGVAKGIDDTTKGGLADWNVDNLACTLDGFSFSDETIGTEKHNTDLTSFQVHAHALDAGSEFDQLLGLDIGHAMDTGDTVTDGQNAPSLSKTCLLLNSTYSLLEDGGNFGGRSFGIGGVGSGLF
jgi:hypothetical protein